MKVFTAALGTETNTFSPMPTDMGAYKSCLYFRPGEHPDECTETTAPLWACRQRANAEGWHLIEGTCAFAHPAGITTRITYESLRDDILDQIKAALPLDMVAISMHGAMVADGYPDCEGDLMARVRELAGPDVVLGLEIDPHCHLSEKMVENTDVVTIFKEYPHTDFRECAESLLDIMQATRTGKVKPVMSVFDCRMIGIFHTPAQPMRDYVNHIRSLEGKNDILSVSVAHGFPWGDVEDMGTKILVITNDAAEKGDALAESLGHKLIALRGETSPTYLDLDQALDRISANPGGPYVIADSPDNPGGGAPGDATYVLETLIRRGITNACLGPLWDPMAVKTAFAAGEGARLAMRIGGKAGKTSGSPVDAEVTVTRLMADAYQTFAGTRSPLGDAAAINIQGIDVVLVSGREQALGTDLFTNMGIDPASRDIIVVKSSQHFHAEFHHLAHDILYIDGPGALGQSLDASNYKNIKRPKWPFDPDPWSQSAITTSANVSA